MICIARVLIRLIEIFHKYGICSLFTGKYNFDVVPGYGICTLFLSPIVGFCMTARPRRGVFATFLKQNDKCPGGWARME